MGINGIDLLKGNKTMEDQNLGQDPETAKDTSAAQPVDAAPESVSPATPASDVAEAASGQPDPADDNPETDTDGPADDEVIETDEPEPALTGEDQGDDSETEQPEVSDESLTADPEDTHGAADHPEA